MSKKPHNPYWDVKMGFWKRLGWVLNYYKLQILAITAAVVVVGYILYINLRPQREIILDVMIVNGNTVAESDLFDRYLDQAGFDILENRAYVSNGIQIRFDGTDSHAYDYYEIVSAQFLTGEIDLYFSDGALFTSFANYNAFQDVSEYMTPEQLERYEDSILYVTNTETGEQMACGIILPPGTEVCDTYFFETCYMGLSASFFHEEEALGVVQQILEQLP